MIALLLAAATALPTGAMAPTPAFDADGRLWVAWVEGPHVYVASSADLGATFSPAVAVNPEPETIDAHGEARPKIAIGPGGEVFVSYTWRLERPYTGHVRFSRSTDGGRTFWAPVTVNDDGLVTGHRFDALTVSPSGDVYLFWIDKRDLERAKAGTYEGAALYQAVSTDRGQTFAANRKLKDNVCECCRLAVAWDGAAPVLLWRDLMEGGVRDHSLARVGDTELAAVRATDDGWAIPACPHHGPALAIDGAGVHHLAWFTGDGRQGKGAFYRRSTDAGRTFEAPVHLGDAGSGRPYLVVAEKDVWLAWKELREGEVGAVMAMRSTDSGASWSKPAEAARTTGDSDHPLLVAHRGRAYLSWLTRADGYRLVDLQ